MADSWLIDGDCEKCRRRKYCTKPCKKNKEFRQHQMAAAFARVMVRHLSHK